MRIAALVVLVGLVAGATPGLHAQSLADAARTEEERRRSIKGSGKVYTNKDLKPVPQPEPAGGGAAVGSTVPADASNATPDAKGTADTKDAGGGKSEGKVAGQKGDRPEEKGEAYWRGRMRALQQQLDQEKTLAEALQSRVNALTTDFVNRDDPAQRAVIAVDRQKALAELDRMQKAVTAETKAIADLEEEARRAGVPPGWLR